MTTRTEVLCLGELLIDFVSSDVDQSLAGSRGFLKAAGGAPANVAAGVARLGRRAGFIGKVGRDPFGDFLRGTLLEAGVDASGLVYDDDARTTLSFVANRTSGERDCIFYRHPGADMLLSPDELDESMIAAAHIMHFGSVSLGCEPVRSATLQAVEWARKHGLLVSYDPNLRLGLWPDETQAKNEIREAFPLADVVKISEEEMAFITGSDSFEVSASFILSRGPRLVFITRGGDGCYYSDGQRSGFVEGHRVRTIETTGAGDAFVAAMLYGLLERHRHTGSYSLQVDEETARIAAFANAAGALATTGIGAIASMPTVAEVEALLNRREDQ